MTSRYANLITEEGATARESAALILSLAGE
jgi:hypothetical protein